ncbi:MAG: hypothetical protein GF313_10205 [Caldithrix sp.]|nr:hypothetical protein [Caldithrix sp.]
MDREEKLQNIAGKICEANNLYLVETRIRGDVRQPVFEVFADSEQGITLAQCENITRQIQDELDMDDDFVGQYRLDVSSPGVDRSLTFDYEFSKNIGQTLNVTYQNKGEKVTVKGKLTGFDDNTIHLQMDKGEADIPRVDIDQAKVHIPW